MDPSFVSKRLIQYQRVLTYIPSDLNFDNVIRIIATDQWTGSVLFDGQVKLHDKHDNWSSNGYFNECRYHYIDTNSDVFNSKTQIFICVDKQSGVINCMSLEFLSGDTWIEYKTDITNRNRDFRISIRFITNELLKPKL